MISTTIILLPYKFRSIPDSCSRLTNHQKSTVGQLNLMGVWMGPPRASPTNPLAAR